jgi:hypothetical protein
MFESGPALFGRTTDEYVTRRFALWMYGIWLLIGLAGSAAVVWKRGTSQPFHLASLAAIFLLSMLWLWTTVKSGPPTQRRHGLRVLILFLLAMWPTYIN